MIAVLELLVQAIGRQAIDEENAVLGQGNPVAPHQLADGGTGYDLDFKFMRIDAGGQ